MNSVANGKVRANTRFEELYIQPAAGDNGTALGAAYYVWNQVLGNPRSFVMEHGYWGTEYPGADVSAIVEARRDDGWTYEQITLEDEDAVCRMTAELIADAGAPGAEALRPLAVLELGVEDVGARHARTLAPGRSAGRRCLDG